MSGGLPDGASRGGALTKAIPSRAGEFWTNREIETLVRLRSVEGLPRAEIAAAMGRTVHAVNRQITKRGISLPSNVTRGKSVRCFGETDKLLREAFDRGDAMTKVARRLGISERAVHNAYNTYSIAAGRAKQPQFGPGDYIGAAEMRAIIAPILGVTAQAIIGDGNYQPAAFGRVVIARALRDRGISLTVIARALQRKDHSTVCNLLHRFPTYSRQFSEVALAYEAIKDAERAAERRAA